MKGFLCKLVLPYFLFTSASPPLPQSKSARILILGAIDSPAKQPDFTTAKLALDRIIDPTINDAQVRRQLDNLAMQARAMLGPKPTDEDKINAVRRVIYKAGPWNGGRPFAYYHTDPLGRNVQNKLLATYLRTRLGNCVSMPTLFLILADRLGLNVSFATAPLHMFIRYTDPQGRAFNIETTSGGNLARLSQYRVAFPMSDRAMESGLFLRTLTRQEAIASMAETVLDWAIASKRYTQAIEIGDAVLERFPRDGYAMLKRGSAYGALFQADCTPPRADSPTARQLCDRLAADNAEDFRKVEALGWKPDE